MTQEKLGCSLEKFIDIMSYCSSDVGYMKHIGMDVETDSNLSPLPQMHTHSLLNIMNGTEKS